MKSIIAAGLLLGMAHGTAAVAGPYVNVENNAGFTGSSYNGNISEFHVGYEGDLGESATYYVQAGPAVVAPDGGEIDTELSGKAGVGLSLSERLSAYGEVSFLTADGDNGYGTKVGLKYSFWSITE